MSAAGVLAALVTLRALGETPRSQSVAAVQEMEGRLAAFAAFGDRTHWLNQLLPGRLHLPLLAALDPEDLAGGSASSALAELAAHLAERAAELLDLVRAGPRAVPGETPSIAQHRMLQQSAAADSAAELEALAHMPAGDLAPWAAQAFWARRELAADQHFARCGPLLPPVGGAETREDNIIWSCNMLYYMLTYY